MLNKAASLKERSPILNLVADEAVDDVNQTCPLKEMPLLLLWLKIPKVKRCSEISLYYILLLCEDTATKVLTSRT